MSCGCKKKKPVAAPKTVPATSDKNYTQKQQEALVNEVINKINKAAKN